MTGFFSATAPEIVSECLRRVARRALILLAIVTCPAGGARAAGVQYRPGTPAEINSISFEGNDELSESELRSQLRTRETPGFFSKFLRSAISENLGRPNEYLSRVTLGEDLERLRTYYERRGFSEARIDTVLSFSDDGTSVGITLRVSEGYRSLVDTLSYSGIVSNPVTVWEDISSGPRIAAGEPFQVPLVEDEVKRVLRVFNDQGFPNAVYLRDSSYAYRYLSTRNYSVRLAFSPGRRYLFGDITLRQEIDTLRGARPRPDITDRIIFDHLDYQPGDFYSLQRRVRSEENLNGLGLFELRRLEATIPSPSDSSMRVPTTIVIRPLDKHEVAPEVLVSDENAAFNLGAGIGYTNRNFLGEARRFTARLRFRTQTIEKFPDYFTLDNDAVANLDLTFEVMQPYIFTNKIKGSWSLSAAVDKQAPYRQNIFRNKVGVSGRLAEFTTGYLDWTLESVSLTKRAKFILSSDPEVVRQFSLLQPQSFNSILSFTIQRDKTNDLFSPSSGFVHSVTVEEAGVLSLLLKNLFRDLPFTQFYRAIVVGRWYEDLNGTRFSVLGLKLKAGLEDKYGSSRDDSTRAIPQTHRFFAGGGGSVRGWASRALIARGDPELGGNLSVEASAELRLNLFQSLRDGWLDKIWLVFFADAGNVWPELRDFEIRKVAVAAGLGFRYDTLVGPFRIDWGFRVFDPSASPGRQWITQRQLIGQTMKEGVFHFGIGHAF